FCPGATLVLDDQFQLSAVDATAAIYFLGDELCDGLVRSTVMRLHACYRSDHTNFDRRVSHADLVSDTGRVQHTQGSRNDAAKEEKYQSSHSSTLFGFSPEYLVPSRDMNF